MYALVSQRLNEGFGAGGPTFYPTVEIVAALNEAQRVFVLLTLGLETTVPWVVPAATTFFHMLVTFPDWVVPLRIATTAGAKVRPGRFSELWSLDSQWPQSPGAPNRYVHAGADLLAVYGQPAAPVTLNVTYARCPAPLVLDADVPEIPAEYHPELEKYARYRLRQVEGGEPFAAALPLLAEFLDAAGKYADYVRARNKGSSYDAQPFELASFDRSRLIGMSKQKK